MDMTPLQQFIDESEKVCDAATPGPYYADPCDPRALVEVAVVESAFYDAVEIYAPRARFIDDPASLADFIAHARTALPTALQYLRELSQSLECSERDAASARIKALREAAEAGCRYCASHRWELCEGGIHHCEDIGTEDVECECPRVSKLLYIEQMR